jgi:hypothetical protein
MTTRLSAAAAYSALRVMPNTYSAADTVKAIGLLRRVRLYPLAQAANPGGAAHRHGASRNQDGGKGTRSSTVVPPVVEL